MMYCTLDEEDQEEAWARPVDNRKKFIPEKLPDDVCAICHDDFEQGDSCLACPTCRIVTHKTCIETWIQNRSTCVQCRSPVWREYKEAETFSFGLNVSSMSTVPVNEPITLPRYQPTMAQIEEYITDYLDTSVLVEGPIQVGPYRLSEFQFQHLVSLWDDASD